jgi:hypothetical protein
MLVTLRTEIAVRNPAITDDRSARFDPVTNDSHQRVGGSILNVNKECFPGLSFHTARHPLTLYRVSPMIFSPTELALVNFDGLIRTTDLSAAALQKHEHDFPAKYAPVCGCMGSQVVFTSYGMFRKRSSYSVVILRNHYDLINTHTKAHTQLTVAPLKRKQESDELWVLNRKRVSAAEWNPRKPEAKW